MNKKLSKNDYKKVENFIDDLRNFRNSIDKKDKRSSIEILRSFRYGEK